MRSLFAFLLFAVAAFSVRAGDPSSTPELEMTATGEIVIAPDGSVQEHVLDKGLAPLVEALVDKSVRTWRFEPILIDGRAVTAKTRMTLELSALPTAEGDYRLSVSQAWFGVPMNRGTQRPPAYPTAAIRAGLGARVLLVAQIDTRGNVVAVHPYQTSLSLKFNNEQRARRWRERFEKVSSTAVMRWKFTPGESIGGEVVGGSVTVPITFTLGPDTAVHNRWHSYVPGPISPAPWVDKTSVARMDTDALNDGDVGPLESRFKLTSDVLGKAL